MGNLAFRRLHHTLIRVANVRAPSTEEWQAYLDACAQLLREVDGRVEQVSVLLFSDGGSPTSPQRLALATLLHGRGVDTAIVTDSGVLRSTGTMISFVNPGIRFHEPHQWREAAAFARVDPAQLDEAIQVVRALALEVGGVKATRALDG